LADDELAGIRNQEIGFVFQTFNLLPRGDRLHNVELPLIYAGLAAPRAAPGDAGAAAGGAGGPDAAPTERAVGGQRQRVAIARAL